MIELELAEIETRLAAYPADAQADIRWLTRELRKLYNLGTQLAEPPASAIYDSVTGLLSGGAYGVRFAAARARAARYKKNFAVMSIELPLLRITTASSLTEGEAAQVLKQVSDRLLGCARATDTVARIDHEKFAMILEELGHPDHAERVKQKVEAALADPVLLEARAIRCGARVSLQFYPLPKPGDAKLN